MTTEKVPGNYFVYNLARMAQGLLNELHQVIGLVKSTSTLAGQVPASLSLTPLDVWGQMWLTNKNRKIHRML